MALTKIDDRGLKTPIDLLDSEKIRFGTGNDLELYHVADGNSFINDTATAGQFIIQAVNGHDIKHSNGDLAIRTLLDGTTSLYYGGGKKFETTSTGTKFTGDYVSFNGNGYIRTDSSGYLRLQMGSNGTMFSNASNTEVARIDTSGRLQIGSSTNTSYNDFDGVGRLNLQNNSADGTVDFTQGIVFTDNASDEGTWTHAGIVATGSTGYNGNLVFGTDGNDTRDQTGITEKMRITAYGNVGIGTDSPTAKLHLFGSGNDFEGLRITNNLNNTSAASSAQIKFDVRNSVGVRTCRIEARENGNNNNEVELKFYTNSSASQNGETEKMVISGTGNVEITDGNLVVASGHGIMFHPHDETTSTPGSDSNLLDDYEEGTFNPTLRGHDGSSWSEVTFDSVIRYGWYTKIGNVCRVWIRFYNFHINSGFDGDLAAIGGLPFSSSNTPYKQNILSICDTNAFAESGVYNIALDYNTNTGITRLISGTGSGYSTFSGSTGRYLTISGSYSVG